jgi:hypothetical protein
MTSIRKRKKGEVPIVIPSMGRPDLIHTHKVFLPERLDICVPDAEVEKYQKAHPDLYIVGHPDNVFGMSAKRQWIYEKYGDVVMIDDDIGKVACLEYAVGEKARFLDPVAATGLCDRLTEEAKQYGAYLFGVSASAVPHYYVSGLPYRTWGWVNGGFTGLIGGSKLAYNSEITASEDYWISALNAYYYRKCLIDTRYALVDIFGNGTMKTKGGLSTSRTLEREKKDLEILQRFFGDAIKRRGRMGIAHQIHEYQKSLEIPWGRMV